MSAVFYEGGGRFSLGRSEPVEPGEGDVRLRVAYCGICGTDVHIAHGAMAQRLRLPQVIGHEMSGVVDAVGAGVECIAVGDEVVVRPLDPRDATPATGVLSHIGRGLKFLGIDTPGAFQAYWTVPAFTLHRLPAGTDLRLAALAEPLAVAVHDVRRGEVRAGERVVVLGGGPIGLLVGLVAQTEGAEVILSEPTPHRLALAAELGFDAVEPRKLATKVEQRTAGAGADVVFEVSGSGAGAAAMTQLAGLRGRIVVVAIFPEPQPINLFDVFWKELQLRGARVYEADDYERAITLVASGSLPLELLVTSVEPLERLPELFARLGSPGNDVKILVDCRS